MNRFWKSRRVRFAAAGAAALAVGVLASSGAVGYAARLVGVTGASPVAAQYPPSKVTICHHTHSQKNPFVTITVSERALPAHLRHGDTIGPCQASVPTVKQVKPSAKHQKPQHFGHKQKGKKSHLTGQLHSTAKGSNGLNQGQGHGQGPSKSQGQAPDQTQGQAQGHAYGRVKEHGPGGQTHGQGATSGHGYGSGNGPGTNRGSSGGANGKGHEK